MDNSQQNNGGFVPYSKLHFPIAQCPYCRQLFDALKCWDVPGEAEKIGKAIAEALKNNPLPAVSMQTEKNPHSP